MTDPIERLRAEHEDFARRLAQGRLRRAGFGAGEAEEVVQDAWIRLLKQGGIPEGREEVPYLARVVLNAARDWLRGGARQARRDQKHGRLPAAAGAPDEPLLRSEEAGGLERAMAGLPSRERLLLRLIYWDGVSYAAAGKVLGISANAVGPLLSRARERLKEMLKKGGTGMNTPGVPRS